jgi:hypothetical protein
MSRNVLPALAVAALAVSTIGCDVSKSSNPLSASVAGPIPGVNISAPQIELPLTGAQVVANQQPVTLTIGNATTNGVRPLNYTFEVAVDAAFANKVFSQDGVVPGSGGQTSLRLPDALGTGHSYYWHARAQDGANTGSFSTVAYFNVFTPIVINAPAPTAPGNNATGVSLTPVFTFTDATRSGPVGPITYTIELALDNVFSKVVAVWTLAEQAGQTQFTTPQLLGYGTQYYWEVRANDPTTTGPWSAIQGFQTVAAPAPPPPPVPVAPTPTGGVLFDHPWSGNVELQLRGLLASGLAGPDGLNGQAVVDQMNALGGIYAGAEFQQHHDGPSGFPTYGFPWFYVSYVPIGGSNEYQIVEFGTPPSGD